MHSGITDKNDKTMSELTSIEKMQAYELAKLQYSEIKRNEKSLRVLNEKYQEIRKEGFIPCDYAHIYKDNYTAPAVTFLLGIMEDIKEGVIVIQKDGQLS